MWWLERSQGDFSMSYPAMACIAIASLPGLLRGVQMSAQNHTSLEKGRGSPPPTPLHWVHVNLKLRLTPPMSAIPKSVAPSPQRNFVQLVTSCHIPFFKQKLKKWNSSKFIESLSLFICVLLDISYIHLCKDNTWFWPGTAHNDRAWGPRLIYRCRSSRVESVRVLCSNTMSYMPVWRTN